jgi:hypothetical protein
MKTFAIILILLVVFQFSSFSQILPKSEDSEYYNGKISQNKSLQAGGAFLMVVGTGLTIAGIIEANDYEYGSISAKDDYDWSELALFGIGILVTGVGTANLIFGIKGADKWKRKLNNVSLNIDYNHVPQLKLAIRF